MIADLGPDILLSPQKTLFKMGLLQVHCHRKRTSSEIEAFQLRRLQQEAEDFRGEVQNLLRQVNDEAEYENDPDLRHARITFSGSPCFIERAEVIVSFPGVYGRAWNKLVRGVVENSRPRFHTTCVFLPCKGDMSKGWGVHPPQSLYDGGCYCHYLYGGFPHEKGSADDFGCLWFLMWVKNTQDALLKGCRLVFVTKTDGSLGNSQKGEKKWLDEKQVRYETITVDTFAEKMIRGDVDSRCVCS